MPNKRMGQVLFSRESCLTLPALNLIIGAENLYFSERRYKN